MLFFLISLCKRNIQCIKYKNCVDFHCLFPYSKDSREMQREQILWGLQCLFWPAHTKLIIIAADSVLTLHVLSPHPLNKLVSSLWLYIFHCLSFSILSHGFERQWTCLYCYMSALFFTFFLTQVLHLFTFARPFFSASFCSIIFFFIVLFLYSHIYAHFFHRPQLYSSASFIRRDYLPVCYSFRLSQSSRNVRLLTNHIPPYSPRVVVIMLNVISNKISVFLWTDSQSTGSLTF